jgi:hypothetical protein
MTLIPVTTSIPRTAFPIRYVGKDCRNVSVTNGAWDTHYRLQNIESTFVLDRHVVNNMFDYNVERSRREICNMENSWLFRGMNNNAGINSTRTVRHNMNDALEEFDPTHAIAWNHHVFDAMHDMQVIYSPELRDTTYLFTPSEECAIFYISQDIPNISKRDFELTNTDGVHRYRLSEWVYISLINVNSFIKVCPQTDEAPVVVPHPWMWRYGEI